MSLCIALQLMCHFNTVLFKVQSAMYVMLHYLGKLKNTAELGL